MSEEYRLEKSLWTDADFEQMGWHDATVWAMAHGPGEFEFSFDVDYILKWVHPAAGERFFNFWVAPATLVFENVSELRIALEPGGEISVQDLYREDPRFSRPGFDGPAVTWRWRLDCNEGEITLRATGMRQTFRAMPQLAGRQAFDLRERGGISFSERPAHLPAAEPGVRRLLGPGAPPAS